MDEAWELPGGVLEHVRLAREARRTGYVDDDQRRVYVATAAEVTARRG